VTDMKSSGRTVARQYDFFFSHIFITLLYNDDKDKDKN